MVREKSEPEVKDAVEVLKDILITQLGIAGVPQHSIRKIVGCSFKRVNGIVRHLKNVKGE